MLQPDKHDAHASHSNAFSLAIGAALLVFTFITVKAAFIDLGSLTRWSRS